jgi:hypothetical protein
LTTFSLLSPFYSLLSPTSWFYDVLIAASIAGVAHIFVRHFSLTPHVKRSRFSDLVEAADPNVVLSLVCHATVGGVLMRSYLGVMGGQYNGITEPCSSHEVKKRCLNEPHLFLVLSGMFVGITLWHSLHFKNGNLLSFSPISQHGSSQIRLKMWGICKSSLFTVANNFKWFFAMYIIYGKA